MLDLIKKSIYLGLGAATATKEKIESLVDELIEKGQLSKDKKTEAVKEIFEKIEKEEQAIYDKVKKTVKETVDNIGIATKKDLDSLKTKIEELEKKL